MSILEAGSFLLALAWLRRSRHWNHLLTAIAVVVAWGAVQILFRITVSPSDTLRLELNWAAYLSLTFVGVQIFQDRAVVAWFLRGLLAFGVLLCVISTLQTFTSPDKVFWLVPVQDPIFVMGPFLNHGQFSAFVELILPLALVPAVSEPRRGLSWSLVVGLMVASVIASASRAGFVLVVIETVVVLGLCAWRDRKGLRRAIPVFLGMVVLTAGLTAVVGWEALGARFLRPDPSRVDMLLSSLEMIREHGLVGVGLGSWPTVYPLYARSDDGLFANEAHNDWAQWTAEGGLLVPLCLAFVAIWAVRKSICNLWAVGPVFVLVHSFVDYPFQKPQIASVAFILLAASSISIERNSRNKA